MRKLGLTVAAVLTIVIAGCATPPAASLQALADLRTAIADLEVEPGTEPGPRYRSAWRVISKVESPDELREIARQFDNPRPTKEIESVENAPGLHYPVGAALFFSFKGRFFDKLQYMAPGSNCPQYFENEATFVAWLEKYDYDMVRLRKAYERDAPKDP